MRRSTSRAFFLAALAGFGAVPNIAHAERCTGRWGGEVPTTITFQSDDRLRYCYRDQCWNAQWIGDKAEKLVFRIGDGSATVEMTATKQGYRAVWRWGNDSARADLTCNGEG